MANSIITINKLNFNLFFFLLVFIYDKYNEKLVKGHLESAEIDSDKLADPFSSIKLPL
jgi:hypothetical protein